MSAERVPWPAASACSCWAGGALGEAISGPGEVSGVPGPRSGLKVLLKRLLSGLHFGLFSGEPDPWDRRALFYWKSGLQPCGIEDFVNRFG